MNLEKLEILARAAISAAILIGLMAGCSKRPLSQAEPVTLDLSLVYDQETSGFDKPGVWEAVPRGEIQLNGVPFNIRGIIQLAGTRAENDGRVYRQQVESISIPAHFERIYLLHGTAWTAPDGTRIAEVVCHYENHSRASLPIIYGRHVRNWWRPPDEIQTVSLAPGSVVAWTGEHPDAYRWGGNTLRLYLTALENPHPERAVRHIDLISTRSEATPVILAITAGPAHLLTVEKSSSLIFQ